MFNSEQMNNFLQHPIMPVEDFTLYPNKEYMISKIEDILKYSSESDLFVEIQDHNGKTITIEDLVNQYYTNPEDYFESTNRFNNNITKTGRHNEHNEQTATAVDQKHESEEDRNQSERKEEVKKDSIKTAAPNEYIRASQISDESQETLSNNIKNKLSEQKGSRELFTTPKINNLSIPSIITLQEFFSNPSWPLPKHDLEQSPCYNIIETAPILNRTRYKCKLHPEILFIDLAGVEHHCKYKDPELHRSEALRYASEMHATISSGEEAA